MPRITPRLIAILMASAALSACSMLGGADVKEKLGVKEKPAPIKSFANDLDGNVRQAQLLRLAGKYDEAIQILSQLTLIAADDARVVGEYGKALAQKGRAQDATQFLRRAIELSPNDASLYSALGVSYDQTGDHVNARAAYERALGLRPGDANVLNNYALSRMLAKDPEGAHQLIALAQSSAVPGDEKIARNVALIHQMAPAPGAAPQPVQAASNNKGMPTPQPVARATAAAPRPMAVAKAQPPIPVVEAPAPNQRPSNEVSRRLAAQSPQLQGPQIANAAPRTLVPAQQFTAAPDLEQTALAVAEQGASATDRSVVMQAVPFDPLAGPVKAKPRPRAVAARKAAPIQQAQVPSLRVATEQY